MIENVIEWIKGQKTATVTACSNTRLKSRVLKLSEKHPDQCKVQNNKDGSICARLPVDWIKINPPIQLTEEQKKVRGDRLKLFHQQKKD